MSTSKLLSFMRRKSAKSTPVIAEENLNSLPSRRDHDLGAVPIVIDRKGKSQHGLQVLVSQPSDRKKVIDIVAIHG